VVGSPVVKDVVEDLEEYLENVDYLKSSTTSSLRVADPLSKSCLGDHPALFSICFGDYSFFEKINTEMVRGSTARRQ